MTPEEIQRAVTELSAFGRAAYERALRSRAPLPEDVLRESVRRIVDNPVVQGVAGFLMVAARAGIPQVGGGTRRPLTEWDSRSISLALGEYALGRPLYDGHPAYQALRAALTEAYALLPNIPRAAGRRPGVSSTRHAAPWPSSPTRRRPRRSCRGTRKWSRWTAPASSWTA